MNSSLKFWYSFEVPEEQIREKEDEVKTHVGVGHGPRTRLDAFGERRPPDMTANMSSILSTEGIPIHRNLPALNIALTLESGRTLD